jgi:hypothetical protein
MSKKPVIIGIGDCCGHVANGEESRRSHPLILCITLAAWSRKLRYQRGRYDALGDELFGNSTKSAFITSLSVSIFLPEQWKWNLKMAFPTTSSTKAWRGIIFR